MIAVKNLKGKLEWKIYLFLIRFNLYFQLFFSSLQSEAQGCYLLAVLLPGF